jgi:hypothetical protein
MAIPDFTIRQPNLADDLRPKLQSRGRVAPCGIGQVGPNSGGDGIAPVESLRNNA